MMKAQRKTNRHADRSPPAGAARTDRVRPWLVGALAALVVARPLLPSEGVSWIGDGQPFNLAWFILATLVCLWMAIRSPDTLAIAARRVNLVDIAVAALVMLVWISAIRSGANEGSPRFLVNMVFEWSSLGLLYFLTRLMVRQRPEARMLVALMIALAVVESCYGYYQVCVSLPADRAAYAADPDGTLRAMGQWYPPGSPERARFESRLSSTEPLATFALTNSLAGLLAPWLIVGVGVVLSLATNRRDVRVAGATPGNSAEITIHLLALAVCLLALAGCLLLTKSRSAFVALAVGLLAIPWTSVSVRRVVDRRVVMAACVALALLVGVAVVSRGLDAPVLTEAGKSLGYRLEYWQSTLAMIRNHFWFGVGPGNFQDFYTQYKLPRASEEIRDPHNLLLEVWATTGTLAMLAFGTALACTFGISWRAKSEQPAAGDDVAPTSASTRALIVMLIGAALGFLAAFLVGPLVGMVFSEEQLLAGLLAGGAVVAITWPWIRRGHITARLLAVGLLVLTVHLLASGGIAFPGVAYSFWLLAALALNVAELQSGSGAEEPNAVVPRRQTLWWRAAAAGLALVVSGGGVACYLFACQPAVAAHAATVKAEEMTAIDPRSPAARVLWMDAANADPWRPEPWSALAELEMARVRANPADSAARQRFADVTEKLNQIRLRSSVTTQQIGRWLDEIDEIEHDPELVKLAARFMRRAIALYPNSPTLRAEYALVLVKAERLTEARRQATIAEDLDAMTPHADKKLPAGVKKRLELILAEKTEPGASEN
jgi:hypothetical protein